MRLYLQGTPQECNFSINTFLIVVWILPSKMLPRLNLCDIHAFYESSFIIFVWKSLIERRKIEFILHEIGPSLGHLDIHLNQFRNFSSMIFWKRLSERHSNCNLLQISNQLTWRIIFNYFKITFFKQNTCL